MALFKATIDVLVDVEDEGEACDCLSETLRPVLREFCPGSSVIDWRYSGVAGGPEPHDGNGFEYAEGVECPDCHGKGAFPETGRDCARCYGGGTVSKVGGH